MEELIINIDHLESLINAGIVPAADSKKLQKLCELYRKDNFDTNTIHTINKIIRKYELDGGAFVKKWDGKISDPVKIKGYDLGDVERKIKSEKIHPMEAEILLEDLKQMKGKKAGANRKAYERVESFIREKKILSTKEKKLKKKSQV